MPRTNGRVSAAAPTTDRGSDLFAPRDACVYNRHEQQFSRYMEGQLEKLLKGEMNCLYLMRRYHQRPDILGAPLPRKGLDRRTLRLTVIEEVLTRVLIFLQTGMPAARSPRRRATAGSSSASSTPPASPTSSSSGSITTIRPPARRWRPNGSSSACRTRKWRPA